MLSGIAIPRDSVEEEEWDVEGVRSDGYRAPPDFVPASELSPPLFIGKPRKRRRRMHSIIIIIIIIIYFISIRWYK